jgi:hypothetical protein
MTDRGDGFPPLLVLLRRISRLEWIVAGAVAVLFVGLVVAEPDIVEAPSQSARASGLVVGGTILAAAALFVMLRYDVAPVIRILVLGVPFALASWWLVAPFFRDTVVHDDFETSIAAARSADPAAPSTTGGDRPRPPAPSAPGPAPAPVLRGSGAFVGLAGHSGTGDGGVFRLADGSHVLRLENFDIDNGPDLQLYLVPGADQRSPTDGSHHFGALRGNVGDQTYEIPGGFAVRPGPWTVLVWCRAFTVEFVAATLTLA